MGRDAVKAKGNPWYEARLRASNWDERLASRAGAAELLGMSEEAVRNTETRTEKIMPVDKAVLMSELYVAPQLLNHYCLCECPIGCHHPMSEAVLDIDRITVKLLAGLNVGQLDQIKSKLLKIAQDGEISDDELLDMREVTEYLEGLVRIVSELKTASEIAIKRSEMRCR